MISFLRLLFLPLFWPPQPVLPSFPLITSLLSNGSTKINGLIMVYCEAHYQAMHPANLFFLPSPHLGSPARVQNYCIQLRLHMNRWILNEWTLSSNYYDLEGLLISCWGWTKLLRKMRNWCEWPIQIRTFSIGTWPKFFTTISFMT